MEPNANPNPAPEVAPAPAPQAPPAPVPEVQPPAEVTPPTPNPDPSPAPPDPEDAEWDDAVKEEFPNHEKKEEPKPDEPAKPKEGDQAKKEGDDNPDPQKPDEKPGEGDDAKAKSENDPKSIAEAAVSEARRADRAAAEQAKAVSEDVRSKMFPKLSEELRDADGDPIRTVEDVQKLINPRTNEPFTPEEAGTWLLSAQQRFNQERAQTEKQIESITELNIKIEHEAAYVNSKYGELLKADTALRDKLWGQYEKTLVKDEASGIITKAPVSLEEFYDIALGPRVEAQQKAQQDAEAAAKVQAEAEVKAKAEAEKTRQQTRSERSDIYQPPARDSLDPEDREWVDAADAVFGNLTRKGI